MRNKPLNAREIIGLLILISWLTTNAIYWCSQKEGFHVDEMYGYTQVGNTQYWRMTEDQENVEYFNRWHDVSYIEDFLTISDEEAFDLKGAWNTAKDNDAHPPLYFVVLELVTSLFFRNHFTKWSGLCTNIPFYVLSLIVLFMLCKKVFRGRFFPSIAVVTIYGISIGAIDTVVFMRMYMMVTLFTLMLIYANTILLEGILTSIDEDVGGNKKSRIIMIEAMMFLTILGGALTHYYFLLFAFLTCGSFLLWLFKNDERKTARSYTLTACLSVGFFMLVCPDFFSDIFMGGRGRQAIKAAAISTPSGWVDNIKGYIKLIAELLMGRRMTAVFLVLFVVVIVVSLILKKQLPSRSPAIEEPVSDAKIYHVILFLSCVVIVGYVLIVSRIAPYQTYRYIFNTIPMIVLIIVYCIDQVTIQFRHGVIIRATAFGVIFAMVLSAYSATGILYLYRGYNERVQILENCRPYQAIVIGDNETQVGSHLASYLLTSQAVYQTTTENISKLKHDKGELYQESIVFIYEESDVSAEEILAQVVDVMDARNAEKLFRTTIGKISVFRLIW